MKKIIFILFIITSCTTPQSLQRTVLVDVYDYRSYLDKGFIFDVDVNKYNYEILGRFDIFIAPEVKKESFNAEWTSRNISNRELLRIIYDEAIKLGANGTINMSIIKKTDHLSLHNIDVDYFTVTGSFIKIID